MTPNDQVATIASGTVYEDALTGRTTVEPAVAARDLAQAHRYETLSVLGAGGMGTVDLCRDTWIGREVAIKPIHADYAFEKRHAREPLAGRSRAPTLRPRVDRAKIGQRRIGRVNRFP